MPRHKIQNKLIPKRCHHCGSDDIKFTGNEVVYKKPTGKWPYCWFCYECEAAVGCHPKTDVPLGTMTNWATRQMRSRAHRIFDPMWKSRGWSRNRAYTWLSRQLGISKVKCHIGMFDYYTCKRAIEICKANQKRQNR